MKIASVLTLMLCAAGVALPALAQAPRQDAIWARRANNGAITLNGNLNEPAWAVAESIIVKFGQVNTIPGSGWKIEGGTLPNDSTYAVLKLLVVGNQMYLGARVKDQSVGGSKDFNRFDGFLMSVKDHNNANAPKPPTEYLYSWWYPNMGVAPPPGQSPSFKGVWAPDSVGAPRTPEQIANWDAVTVVHGQSNNDTILDTGYTVEMRFNMAAMGYDLSKPTGEIIEWNISIYDCDWLWPINVLTLAYNRVWEQSPWGGDAWYHEIEVHARPDVTVASTNPLPEILPDVFVPDGASFAAPTMNGTLTEPVWGSAYTFDIRYGDSALRQTYPGVGPYRAGQFQPIVNGGQALVADPGDATVRMFHRGDLLYLGFDFRDEYVQYHANFNRWDGAIVTINDRDTPGPDNNLAGRRLSFQMLANGSAGAEDDLLALVTNGDATLVGALKAGSTVDTLGLDTDAGWTAELSIDLTALGYPAGLGDRILFIGVDLLDGDSFDVVEDSYGTRTWWFREYENQCCPAWAHLGDFDPTDAAGAGAGEPQTDAYLVTDTYPNPGVGGTIRYRLAQSSDVTLEIYDVAGRLVERRALGRQEAGTRFVSFDGRDKAAGVYLFRLNVRDPNSGAKRISLQGRMTLVK
jgi:hypothetical protein